MEEETAIQKPCLKPLGITERSIFMLGFFFGERNITSLLHRFWKLKKSMAK